MKLKLTKLLFLVLGFLLLPTLSLAEINFPPFPMAFWGNAILNSLPLPAGTKIRAYCGNSLIGEIIMIESGIYGYNEATKNKLLVSNCDGDILFKYLPSGVSEALTGSLEIKYTNGFISGAIVQKDLNFIITTSPSANGGGSSSGGGTNVPIPTPTPTPTAMPKSPKKGDINNDNKVDKYDFSLMMANWGKIGTNDSDLNNDGKVNKYDFALLMLNWSI